MECIRFAITGLDHSHIYGMTDCLLKSGGEATAFFEPKNELARQFSQKYPNIRRVVSFVEILDDPSIQLVLNAGIPALRAQTGISVMKSGKDYLVDKPGAISLEQLDKVNNVQCETARMFSVFFNERYMSFAAEKADEIIGQGVIGKVEETVYYSPHFFNPSKRPSWFFKKKQYGGILTDIGSHGFDSFLHYTRSQSSEIEVSFVANTKFSEFPEFEDLGSVVINGDEGRGLVHVTWLDDYRLREKYEKRVIIKGSKGYIEITKNYCNKEQLFLVIQTGKKEITIDDIKLSYGSRLVSDIVERTETSNPQKRTFDAMALAIEAEKKANTFGFLNE